MAIEPQRIPIAAPADRPPGHSHELRPGFWMHWDGAANGPEYFPASGSNDLLFLFLLGENWSGTTQTTTKNQDAGRMLLLRTTPSPACEFRHGTAFRIALSASAGALKKLLAWDNTPGGKRVRRHTTDSDEVRIELPLTSAARFSAESIRRCPFALPARHFGCLDLS